MLVQLKPHHEAFYRFVFDKLMRLNVLILCEGKTEVEVVKKIAEKLRISLQDFSVGVTDCEGIEVVPQMTSSVLALARLSRRLKVMVVIIDAEDMNIEDRIRSFADGLRARGARVSNPSPIDDQVYSVKITVENRALAMIIAINGVFTFEIIPEQALFWNVCPCSGYEMLAIILIFHDILRHLDWKVVAKKMDSIMIQEADGLRYAF